MTRGEIMKFKAKLDDSESRAFWESVRKGARAYDAMPLWQKGVLGPRARILVDDPDKATAEADSSPEPGIQAELGRGCVCPEGEAPPLSDR
jgi:hypothetical protein